MSDQSAARVAADSLGLHMLREIVDQFMQLPGFSSLTTAQQQVHLERLDRSVRHVIAEALGIIFSAEYPAVIATLGRISIGKGIIGSFDVDRTAESRHELMDRAGQKVVIVMADPDRYYQRMTDVKATADQGDLFHDPSQPLGHMGVDSPPQPPQPEGGGGAGEAFAGGESGLDDALPAENDIGPVEMLTVAQVCIMLGAHGVAVEIEIAEQWPESQLQDAAVWAIAAEKMEEPPPVPEFLRSYIMVPSVEVLEGDGPAVEALAEAIVDVEPAPRGLEPIEIPDGAIDAEIVAGLKLRGITVKAKLVRNWSQSQRIAAVSWLQSRSPHRPDFLPGPDEAKPA
jgi:hypothetical protein